MNVDPARASAWLRRLTLMAEVLLVGALVFAVVAWRLAWSETIEIGGDALKVWEFARQLAHGEPLPHHFDHHTARFGLVVPTLAAQRLLGSAAPVYYAAPLTSSVLMHLGAYLLARRVSGVLAGVVAVGCLLLLPETARASSQILPEAFGPTYTVFAVLSAVAYAQTRSPRLRGLFLMACAVCLFCAYGSKVSYLYFAPGCAYIVWRGSPKRDLPGASTTELRRRFGHAAPRLAHVALRVGRALQVDRLGRFVRSHALVEAALLTAAVCGLIALETVFYMAWTEQSSQIGVVTKTHGVSRSAEIRNAADFFAIFDYAGPNWHLAFALGLPALLGLPTLARDKRATGVVVTLTVFLLLHTFLLRKLAPPIPWMQPHPRYLLAMAPLLAVVIGAFFNESLAGLLRRSSRRRPSVSAAVPGVAAVAITYGLLQEAATDWDERWEKKDGITRTERAARLITNAFERGIPITSRTPQAKPLRAAGAVYIPPGELMIDGRLAEYNHFMGRFNRGRYLAQVHGVRGVDKAELRKRVNKLARRGSCVMELNQRYRHFRGVRQIRHSCPTLPSADDL